MAWARCCRERIKFSDKNARLVANTFEELCKPAAEDFCLAQDRHRLRASDEREAEDCQFPKSISQGINAKADLRNALTRRDTILAATGVLLGGCRAQHANIQPSVEFTRIPQADEGGREKHDIIEGRVAGARPGQQIVLYARSGTWWVQPLVTQPFTKIGPNSKWSNATHLGTEYAALLVEPGYRPPATANVLPSLSGAVSAVAVAKGAASPPSVSLRFSGYEWRVRDAPSSRGGANIYDPKNAWTDASGALHLRIAKASGKWTCAEVSLTRSLGFGTY